MKTVFFDLGNVLIRVDHAKLIRELAPHTPFSPQKIYNEIARSKEFNSYQSGATTSNQFHDYLKSSLQLTLSYNRFKPIWNNIFAPIKEMIRFKDLLKNPKFLISDTNELHFNYIAKNFPECRANLDGMILSYRIGALKPSARIFRAGLEKANTSPKDSIFIDDLEKNTDAAKKLDMNAIHHTSPKTTRQSFIKYK